MYGVIHIPVAAPIDTVVALFISQIVTAFPNHKFALQSHHKNSPNSPPSEARKHPVGVLDTFVDYSTHVPELYIKLAMHRQSLGNFSLLRAVDSLPLQL